MSRFTVRLSEPNEAPAITELLRACYATLMVTAYEPKVLAAALPSMTRANVGLLASGTFFVAQSNSGELVGCGGWTQQVPGKCEVIASIGHIRHFATHADWIRQGIGRALYAACEAQASVAGITEFNCFASLNAEGFYAALGFEPVERIAVAMPGASFPAVLMRRKILPSPENLAEWPL